MKLSIIIPAYNESGTIGALIEKLGGLYPDAEIIVVDDGSTDGTAAAAQQGGARVVRHPYNIGNGAAVKTGIRAALGDILVFMDGDGQHDPKDVDRLLSYFPEYDMVVGARKKGGQTTWRGFGNAVYNRLASYVAKFQIEDLTSGFRAVKADIARPLLYLFPNTYSYPTTLTLSVLRSGRSVKYIPIAARKRASGKSNIRLVRDGVRFFMIITKICTLYSPFRVFLPVSFMLFVFGLWRYIFSFITQGRFTNMSAVLFTSAVMVFMLGLVSEQISQMRYERSEDDARRH